MKEIRHADWTPAGVPGPQTRHPEEVTSSDPLTLALLPSFSFLFPHISEVFPALAFETPRPWSVQVYIVFFSEFPYLLLCGNGGGLRCRRRLQIRVFTYYSVYLSCLMHLVRGSTIETC